MGQEWGECGHIGGHKVIAIGGHGCVSSCKCSYSWYNTNRRICYSGRC